jgi:hypothetical protein
MGSRAARAGPYPRRPRLAESAEHVAGPVVSDLHLFELEGPASAVPSGAQALRDRIPPASLAVIAGDLFSWLPLTGELWQELELEP